MRPRPPLRGAADHRRAKQQGAATSILGRSATSARRTTTHSRVQWPRLAGQEARETRFFADGRFYHVDGKARFSPTPFRKLASPTSARFPFVLNTGRIRDQWHTMTRSAKTPRLMAHVSEPFVEIHPADAAAIGVAPADLAEIESTHGRAILRVVVTERQRRGSLFAPMHWTDQHASLARVDALIGAAADPISGQPELNGAPVAARRFEAAWYAFVTSTRPIAIEEADYFAAAVTGGGWRAELAGIEAPLDWTLFALRMLTLGDDADLIAYHDAAAGRRRFVAFHDGVFVGALFAATGPIAVARSWLAERLGEPVLPDRTPAAADWPARSRGATAGQPSAPASTWAATRSWRRPPTSAKRRPSLRSKRVSKLARTAAPAVARSQN